MVKNILVGEYKKVIFLHQAVISKDVWKTQFLDDPIMATTNLFGNIINIHPFENGNGKICDLILAHVLTQMKCCLFPAILSSFQRRGRRHYIRTVKTVDRKPSTLCTMILKSLMHWWDNFEKNARNDLTET